MKRVVLQGLSLLRFLIFLGIVSSLFWINSLISIPDSFTLIYVRIQIIVLFIGIVILWLIKGWKSHTNTIASILTVFGVLGTFIGIYQGLQGFNPGPEVMQESIENILVGLKTAFITSIVGIISALIIKAVISPIGQNLLEGKDTNDEAINKLANRFADELKNRFESFEAPWEVNISLKLEDLAEVFKEESSVTRKVFSNMQTDLTEGQNRTLTQLETLTTTVSEKQSELFNGVIPLLTTIQDSQTNEENGVIAKLEVLTRTVSEKQNELLNGVIDALTPIQTSLMDEQTGVLTKLEELTRTVSEKHDALLNGTMPILTEIQDSQTNEENGVIAKLEVLTRTVSEKQNELLNGVIDALTPIQTSLMDEQTGVLTKLEELTRTVSEKHDALLNGTMPILTKIQDSLADEQTGVLTKLEALTATVSDEHEKLKKEFETFSNNVAESITKLATNELISALSDVIEQFNAKITEQFGDNFKQLNEAVGKTVEWQQQYREQMNELADEFLLALEGIERSENALQNVANSSSAIVERSNSIVSCAEKLEPILHTMNDQLEAFGNLRQNANDAFPLIEGRLNQLTNGFSSTVQEAITNSQTSMKAQRETFQGQSDQLQSIINGLDNFTKQIEQVTETVSITINNLQQGYVSMQGNLVSMQETLDQQLTESLNTLAGKLAALSEKFVEDYTPLTESLREVLMIAEGSRSRNPRN